MFVVVYEVMRVEDRPHEVALWLRPSPKHEEKVSHCYGWWLSVLSKAYVLKAWVLAVDPVIERWVLTKSVMATGGFVTGWHS